MSMPIKYCQIVNAFDKGNLRVIKERLRKNILYGGFSLAACDHDPGCRRLTEAEIDELQEFIASVKRKTK